MKPALTIREKTGALAILEALNRGHVERGGVDADKGDTRPQTSVEAALSQGAHISPRHEDEWAVWWVGNDGDYHEGTGETPELAAEVALNGFRDFNAAQTP